MAGPSSSSPNGTSSGSCQSNLVPPSKSTTPSWCSNTPRTGANHTLRTGATHTKRTQANHTLRIGLNHTLRTGANHTQRIPTQTNRDRNDPETWLTTCELPSFIQSSLRSSSVGHVTSWRTWAPFQAQVTESKPAPVCKGFWDVKW